MASSRAWDIYRVTLHFRGLELSVNREPNAGGAVLRECLQVGNFEMKLDASSTILLAAVERAGTQAFSLQVGKRRHGKKPNFDTAEQKFGQVDAELATYAECVILPGESLCGIQRPAATGASSKRYAEMLEQALQTCVRERWASGRLVDCSVQLRMVPDSRDLFDCLSTAYSIRSIALTVLRPNPWDEDKDFQTPTAKTVEALKASKAITKFSAERGDSLERDSTTKLARRITATGGAVTASVKQQQAERAKDVKSGDRPLAANLAGDASKDVVAANIIVVHAQQRDGE